MMIASVVAARFDIPLAAGLPLPGPLRAHSRLFVLL
jgi:hypothetical protein